MRMFARCAPTLAAHAQPVHKFPSLFGIPPTNHCIALCSVGSDASYAPFFHTFRQIAVVCSLRDGPHLVTERPAYSHET